MDLVIIHEKIGIPARCPFNFTWLSETNKYEKYNGKTTVLEFVYTHHEYNIIREDNIFASDYFLGSIAVWSYFDAWGAGLHFRVPVVPLTVFVLHTVKKKKEKEKVKQHEEMV